MYVNQDNHFYHYLKYEKLLLKFLYHILNIYLFLKLLLNTFQKHQPQLILLLYHWMIRVCLFRLKFHRLLDYWKEIGENNELNKELRYEGYNRCNL